MRVAGWVLMAALAAALATTAAPAMADDARPPWEGVWQGTIGTLPVRACLAQHDADRSNGSYYYLGKLVPIALQKESGNPAWTEHEGGGVAVGGFWTFSNSAPDRLAGQWKKGSRSLPIALSRVAANLAQDGPCGSAEYSAPRVRPARVVPSPASKAGIAFTKLTYNLGPGYPDASITSFAIREQQPGDRAINAALRVDPARFEGEADYLSCDRLALAMSGTGGYFAYSAEPDLLTTEYLSAEISSGGDCGGAHPDDSTFHRTFDRKTGRRIDLGSWFNARAVLPRLPDDTGDYRQLSAALRNLVVRHFRSGEPECREAVAMADYWDLGLDRRGIAFTPSLAHVAAACEETTVVPFAALSAMLSPAGKAGAARLGI